MRNSTVSTSKKFSFDVSVWSFLLWQFHLSVGNPGNSLIWSVFTYQLIFCVYNIWSINYRRSIHHLSAIIVLNFCQVKWVNKNIYRIINSSDYKATLYELLVKVVFFFYQKTDHAQISSHNWAAKAHSALTTHSSRGYTQWLTSA